MPDELYWYSLFRNGSREIKDMIVAWPEEEDMIRELEAYLAWDKSRASLHELVRFPRTHRTDLHLKDGRLNYHLVWEDYQNSEEDIMKSWSS